VFGNGSGVDDRSPLVNKAKAHASVPRAGNPSMTDGGSSRDGRPLSRRGASVVVIGVAAVLYSVATCGYSAATPGDEGLITQRQQAIVSAFAAAIVHDDHVGIVAHATPDITWTIPGSSVVSGRATGIDEVTRLADTFAQYGLHITPMSLAFGSDTVAVTLHDTGEHTGKRLDQDVVNVLTIRDDKISDVTAHLTDIDSFDAYFS
jgi:ketosteroid isomerase-like protein